MSIRNINRSSVMSSNGMVCAAQPLAAQVGIDILKAGGNCIDAAVATNAMLGLTEPAMCGPGGDLFAIIWIEKDKQLYGLNASGRAPENWDIEKAGKLNLSSIPRRSPLSWTVPGCVSGWDALLNRFGTSSLANCLTPAIHYAKDGFPLTEIIAESFNIFTFPADDEAPHPSLARLYNPDEKCIRPGHVFTNPDLARTYELLAEQGPDAFYEGEIGERIVGMSNECSGFLSKSDFSDHRVTWEAPISINYRGFDVWELPPNGQGLTVLQMLNILEQFDVSDLASDSPEYFHLHMEAKKLVFEDRARYYADPDFATVDMHGLLSKDYARQRAKLIDPLQANNHFTHGDPKPGSDTTYLCCADREGNMISLIQSVYHPFGSTLCPPGTGFSMQSRGMAFSLDPNHHNRLEPRKRPFHTIIPAFVTKDDRPYLAYGVMGADFQPQGQCQVLMNMIDFGLSPQAAGEHVRLCHEGSTDPWGGRMDGGGVLIAEAGFPEKTRAKLMAMGHRFSPDIMAHGGYQAIMRLDSPLRYIGGSDPRKDGMSIGY